MLLSKKQYTGISIALMVSPIIFEICMALDTSALFSHGVFCTFRWADPKRCSRICVLHEWWCLWIFHGEVVWKCHHHTICPQGNTHVPEHMNNISVSCLRFLNSLFCFSAVAHPRWARVFQQPVGSIVWPTGPGGGALPAPWARCWGLAHFQQHGGQRSGGSGNPQWHRPTTCVLHHLHRWLVIKITLFLTFCARHRLFLFSLFHFTHYKEQGSYAVWKSM